MAISFIIPSAVALLLTLIAAVTDTRTGHIPNWLTFPPILLAPVVHAVTGGPWACGWSIFGILVCGALPYIMFLSGGMGGGDVKLFAALGGVFGPGRGLEILLAAMVVGALYSLVKVAQSGRLKGLLQNTWIVASNWFLPASKKKPLDQTASETLRLGLAIFIGTMAVVAWRSVEAP